MVKFFGHPDSFCRPFMDFVEYTATEVLLYSDALRNFRKGFRAWCQDSWTFGQWDYRFMCDNEPSIEYLELYAVTVAVNLWLNRFKNMRIYLFCDNQSVVNMINNSSSKCKNCMVLIRIITLESMIQNTRVFCKHVGTKSNGIADSLSRLDLNHFARLVHETSFAKETVKTVIPVDLWPMSKIWLK